MLGEGVEGGLAVFEIRRLKRDVIQRFIGFNLGGLSEAVMDGGELSADVFNKTTYVRSETDTFFHHHHHVRGLKIFVSSQKSSTALSD